jgi:Icc-related predicted phosphoesterase
MAARTVTVAAIADLHYSRSSQGQLPPLLDQLGRLADVLALCGDLTDFGLPEEASLLAKDLALAKLPLVAVLGNHDYESGHADEVKHILQDVGVHILDGDTTDINGVGFAGTKGFAGGFGRGTLGRWGEPATKHFVDAAVEEALKLETALARLRTPQRVALLHYAPIAQTVAGEPAEIFPWLGTSRLEEPLNRYKVSAVFHGHAHSGAFEGRTSNDTPVYNVSLPLLRRLHPDRPFHLLSLTVDEAAPIA